MHHLASLRTELFSVNIKQGLKFPIAQEPMLQEMEKGYSLSHIDGLAWERRNSIANAMFSRHWDGAGSWKPS